MVNAYPLFVEPIPRDRRGILAAMYVLCLALGGAIGDPLNGSLFDLVDGYRPLFLMMAAYTALAFATVLVIPRGAGEADTGPAEGSGPSTGSGQALRQAQGRPFDRLRAGPSTGSGQALRQAQGRP